MRLARRAATAAALLGASAGGVAAADGAPIRIELNKLAPREGACEAYLVLRNPGGAALETLRLDLVMFDGDGVIARRLAVEAGPVSPDKTSVRAFLIEGVACEAVGTMLLNDVAACADASGPRTDCLGMLALDARPGLDFTM